MEKIEKLKIKPNTFKKIFNLYLFLGAPKPNILYLRKKMQVKEEKRNKKSN